MNLLYMKDVSTLVKHERYLPIQACILQENGNTCKVGNLVKTVSVCLLNTELPSKERICSLGKNSFLLELILLF